MAERRIETRIYLAADLAPGAELRLDPTRAHFLRSVLRLEAGARLAAFNARDGEWLARIEGLGKGWCAIRIETLRRAPEPEPDLWLVFAPIKRARIDFLAAKATELGCSVLQPVMTRRSTVARVNCERLATNAREAAEQCGRLSVPEVREPLDLGALIAAGRSSGACCCAPKPAPRGRSSRRSARWRPRTREAPHPGRS